MAKHPMRLNQDYRVSVPSGEAWLVRRIPGGGRMMVDQFWGVRSSDLFVGICRRSTLGRPGSTPEAIAGEMDRAANQICGGHDGKE